MDKHRIFISIELPLELKEYFESIQNREVRWIKWMNPENYHITLNFLGDLSADEIEKAKEIIFDATGNFSPFNLRISSLQPRRDMLWAMAEKHPELMRLQDTLKTKLKKNRLGKRERMSYIPHILIGKSKTGRAMRGNVIKFEPKEFEVRSICLYKSELLPEAAKHTFIERFLFEN